MAQEWTSVVSELVGGGVAVVVAAADAHARPVISRGWGPSLDAGRGLLGVGVGAPSDWPIAECLEVRSRVSVTLTEMRTYRSVRLGGVVSELRAPTEAEDLLISRHLEEFLAVSRDFGLGGAVRYFFTGVIAYADIVVDEAHVQTPGPDAGMLLGGTDR